MTDPEWWLTAEQWLNAKFILELTEYVSDIGSARKLRLFLSACCHRIAHLLVDPRSRAAFESLSHYADSAGTPQESPLLGDMALLAKREMEESLCRDGCLHSNSRSLAAAAISLACTTAYQSALRSPFYRNSTVTCAANAAAVAVGSEAYEEADRPSNSSDAQRREQTAQIALVRDIFGNPFRPVILDPRWRTEAVVALTIGIYEERASDRMPILADALEEAGCDNPDILAHCRGDGPHVRGCWVVDLVLGKE